jgi:hypothetical protein
MVKHAVRERSRNAVNTAAQFHSKQERARAHLRHRQGACWLVVETENIRLD